MVRRAGAAPPYTDSARRICTPLVYAITVRRSGPPMFGAVSVWHRYAACRYAGAVRRCCLC